MLRRLAKRNRSVLESGHVSDSSEQKAAISCPWIRPDLSVLCSKAREKGAQHWEGVKAAYSEEMIENFFLRVGLIITYLIDETNLKLNNIRWNFTLLNRSLKLILTINIFVIP